MFRIGGSSAAAIIMFLLAASAGATTIVVPTDAQLVEKSPLIVRGTVLNSTPVVRGSSIWTETLILVEATVKGSAAGTLTVREPGGVLGDRITKIYGSPEYTAGERVLAFLAPTGRGDYQTVDMFLGRFEEARGTDGSSLWMRSAADTNVDLLGPDLEPREESRLNRDAARFESFIAARARGELRQADYFVNTAKQMPLRTQADFTLIDEPTVYRWFAFDNGGSVSWRSSGSQPGYTGGGLNEVRTAIGSWTGYAGARIRYNYDGTFSSAPAGLDRSNGINEILLNDPLGEIAGSFNSSTGGVVGRGGFNGVSSARSWTAPFAADTQHGQRSYTAWNITEGNLVIQDGVSPSAGMNSNRLAEIIAHEFGHTLGFGHSEDGGALMSATVKGIGPHLRNDDQLAARWLYPNPNSGGGTNPPTASLPAAPSSLTASFEGTSVVLRWSDNAADETIQRIYYAPSGANFLPLGEAGANQRSATLTGFGDGTWRFYVTASNSAGESAPSNTATLTISTAPANPLEASFTFSPGSAVVVDGPVSFTDTSTGGVTARFWNFGDTTTSTQATPVKRYGAPGTYTVTLTVFRGSESRVATSTITVVAQSPVQPPADPPAGRRRAAGRG
jgi:hypothetical protein